MAYGAKTKVKKKEKKMKGEKCSVCGDSQHKVPKVVENFKKVKPSEVFGEQYKKSASPKKKAKKGKSAGKLNKKGVKLVGTY